MQRVAVKLPEALKLFGIDYDTGKRWVTLGLIPFSLRDSRKKEHILDERGLLAIGLVQTLRRNNVNLPVIRRLTGFLGRTTTNELLAAFNRGEVLLVSVGEDMPPRLMDPQWKIANRSGFAELLVAVDLEKAYRRVSAAISHLKPNKTQPDAEAKTAAATL